MLVKKMAAKKQHLEEDIIEDIDPAMEYEGDEK